MEEQPNRCRIILLATPKDGVESLKTIARSKGLIVAVILHAGDSQDAEFEAFCKTSVSLLQAAEIATLVADNTQVMGRSSADGLLLKIPSDDLQHQISDFQSKLMVGVHGVDTRHTAMEVGEAKPDFVLFGRLDGKRRERAHPKDVELTEWWASVIEVPCVIIAGSKQDDVLNCAKTGADFVAIDLDALSRNGNPADLIRQLDAQLEENAPRFEEVPA